MRRHNERIYRTVRAIVGDDDTAEQLLQHTFVHAYANLRQYDRMTPFAIWLTRIPVQVAAGHRQASGSRGDTSSPGHLLRCADSI